MTVVWQVYYLKWSHKDYFEATSIAVYPNEIYGGLKVNGGEVHDYLGTDKIIVKVSMIKYLNNVVRQLIEHIWKPASSSAAEHIFKVIPESEAK